MLLEPATHPGVLLCSGTVKMLHNFCSLTTTVQFLIFAAWLFLKAYCLFWCPAKILHFTISKVCYSVNSALFLKVFCLIWFSILKVLYNGFIDHLWLNIFKCLLQCVLFLKVCDLFWCSGILRILHCNVSAAHLP